MVVVGDCVVEKRTVVLGESRGVHSFFGEQARARSVGVGRVGVDDSDAEPACLRQVGLLTFEFLVVGAGCLDGGGSEQGVEATHTTFLVLERGVPLRLLVEVLKNIGDHGRDTLRVHVGAVGIDAFNVVIINAVSHAE